MFFHLRDMSSEIFVPESVSRRAAMSPPYSPYPLNEVLENENGSELVVPPLVLDDPRPPDPIPSMIGAAFETGTIAKRKERKKRQRQQQRLVRRNKSVRSASVIYASRQGATEYVREGKRMDTFDPYYGQRYEAEAKIDGDLSRILNEINPNFFLDKSVTHFGCGVGFIAFYIAAFLGAARVVALDADSETILKNCAQLRKFKHDGIVISSDESERFPQLCVRRCGAARITNKPWRIESETERLNPLFPFNIQFGLLTEDHSADIVITRVACAAALDSVKSGGHLVVLKEGISDLRFELVKKFAPIHVYLRVV
jgi:hypothetical protein